MVFYKILLWLTLTSELIPLQIVVAAKLYKIYLCPIRFKSGGCTGQSNLVITCLSLRAFQDIIIYKEEK